MGWGDKIGWDRGQMGLGAGYMDNIWSFGRSFNPGLHSWGDKPPILMSQSGCASPEQLGPGGRDGELWIGRETSA